ncbi:MAG: DUF1573 domain-containing protein [Bacteroides sp.]|nr:DUF1573 domain-containing protein [Bacteroides sp.]
MKLRTHLSIKLIALLVLTIGLSSCSGRVAREQDALSTIIGQEITFPSEMVWQIQNTTLDDFLQSTPDYRIVTYVDSAGCTPCAMKLPLWNGVMDELASIPDTDIELLMIVKSPKTFDLDYTVRSSSFLHPVCYDSAGVFSRYTTLPDKASHRTFLVDSDCKILAVGNPAVNPKVRELYRQIISDGEQPQMEALCTNPTVNFGLANPGDTIIRQFELQNNGDMPLSIQGVTPSCHCVSAVLTQPTVPVGGSTRIEVAYVADSIPGRKNRYVDVYFNEKESPQRLALYGRVITNQIN